MPTFKMRLPIKIDVKSPIGVEKIPRNGQGTTWNSGSSCHCASKVRFSNSPAFQPSFLSCSSDREWSFLLPKREGLWRSTRSKAVSWEWRLWEGPHVVKTITGRFVWLRRWLLSRTTWRTCGLQDPWPFFCSWPFWIPWLWPVLENDSRKWVVLEPYQRAIFTAEECMRICFLKHKRFHLVCQINNLAWKLMKFLNNFWRYAVYKITHKCMGQRIGIWKVYQNTWRTRKWLQTSTHDQGFIKSK